MEYDPETIRQIVPEENLATCKISETVFNSKMALKASSHHYVLVCFSAHLTSLVALCAYGWHTRSLAKDRRQEPARMWLLLTIRNKQETLVGGTTRDHIAVEEGMDLDVDQRMSPTLTPKTRNVRDELQPMFASRHGWMLTAIGTWEAQEDRCMISTFISRHRQHATAVANCYSKAIMNIALITLLPPRTPQQPQ